MNSTILPVCSPDCYSYTILGDLRVEIIVECNRYQIPINALFSMAARRNTKRGFLFVSKVLGKHIPVHPLIPFIGGAALAARFASMVYNEEMWEKNCDFAQALISPLVREQTWEYISKHPLKLPQNTLFIGFAETATALGHSMFSCYAQNAQYIHTTRENILGMDNVLNFLEEHSHATEHYCYAASPTLFANEDMIVLVDDEITTGKSALNFIKAIQKKYPRKKYGLVSLLDWRSEAQKQSFADAEKELGISIHTISLLSGNIIVSGEPVLGGLDPKQEVISDSAKPVIEKITLENDLESLLTFSSVNICGDINPVPYLHSTGRFGINSREQLSLESRLQVIGRLLQQKRQGKKTLCLGTGEFMYIPFKLASYMGEGVSVQSTTRSPIHPAEHVGYAVRQAITFSSPEDHSISNYVYNIPIGYYDEVFIFLERAVAEKDLQSLINSFAPLNIPRICFVTCVTPCQSDSQGKGDDAND